MLSREVWEREREKRDQTDRHTDRQRKTASINVNWEIKEDGAISLSLSLFLIFSVKHVLLLSHSIFPSLSLFHYSFSLSSLSQILIAKPAFSLTCSFSFFLTFFVKHVLLLSHSIYPSVFLFHYSFALYSLSQTFIAKPAFSLICSHSLTLSFSLGFLY